MQRKRLNSGKDRKIKSLPLAIEVIGILTAISLSLFTLFYQNKLQEQLAKSAERNTITKTVDDYFNGIAEKLVISEDEKQQKLIDKYIIARTQALINGLKEYPITTGRVIKFLSDMERGDLFNHERSYYISLININLEGANLAGIQLKNAYLLNANLKNAELTSAKLDNAVIGSANLENARLEYCSFKKSDLLGANLKNSNMEGSYLTGANLSHANLENTYLRFSFIEGAHLFQTNFVDAFLQDSGFQNAKKLETAIFSDNEELNQELVLLAKQGEITNEIWEKWIANYIEYQSGMPNTWKRFNQHQIEPTK